MHGYMGMALRKAELALEVGEVPVGCVFISPEGEVVAEGHNETNATMNASRHAELVAIDASIRKTGDASKIAGSTLYVTCEPCIMCSAALGSLGIGSVVFGCSNDKFGGCGSILSLHNGLTTSALAFPCQGGVREEEAIELFRRFYERPNDKAPIPKRSKLEDD